MLQLTANNKNIVWLIMHLAQKAVLISLYMMSCSHLNTV